MRNSSTVPVPSSYCIFRGSQKLPASRDEYLDDDVDGKGLKASNIPSDGKVYSGLANAWDEGFGYYGAARNFSAYTDAQIKAGEYLDTDGDGLQDLKTEKNWGNLSLIHI